MGEGLIFAARERLSLLSNCTHGGHFFAAETVVNDGLSGNRRRRRPLSRSSLTTVSAVNTLRHAKRWITPDQFDYKSARATPIFQRELRDEARAAFAGRTRQSVKALEHSAGQRDIDALYGVVEQRRVQSYDTEHPTSVGGILAQGFQAGRRREGLTRVESRIDPSGGGFLRAGDSLIQTIAGREATGQIRDNHAEGGRFVTGFDGDGVAHVNISQPGLFPNGGNQADSKILLWVRNDNMAWALGMLKNMMRAANAIQNPARRFQFSNQVGTLHFAHHTH
jgi:hypothetical protein